MTSKTTNTFSTEAPTHAVRMAMDHQSEPASVMLDGSDSTAAKVAGRGNRRRQRPPVRLRGPKTEGVGGGERRAKPKRS